MERIKLFFRAGSDVTAVTPYESDKFTALRPGETAEEYARRLGSMENFEALLKMNRLLELKAGLSLTSLKLEEQYESADALLKMSGDERDMMLDFARQNGLQGLRAMLNTGQADRASMANSCEAMGPLLTKELLSKYVSIMDAAHKTEQELSDYFFSSGQKFTEEQRRVLRGELAKRAKAVLTDFFSEVGSKDGVEHELELKVVLDKLEAIQQNMVVFAGLFKSVFKGSDQVDFEQIKDLSFGSFSPRGIDDKQKSQMLLIARENWKQQEKSLPGITDLVTQGLRSKLDPDNHASRFSVLSKGDRVVSFVRFDDRPDLGENAVYAGSLNVSPLMHGSAIGEAVMRNAIDSEAKEHVIHADVFPEVQAGTSYVENFGFVITGVEEVKVADQKIKKSHRYRRLLIRRDDASLTDFKLKTSDLKKEQIMAMANGQAPGNIEVRRYDLRVEKDKFLDDIANKSASGMVGTRYIADPHDPNIRYVAFEPGSSSARKAA